MISSSVDLKESTNVVGKSLINPTVSTNKRFIFLKKISLLLSPVKQITYP